MVLNLSTHKAKKIIVKQFWKFYCEAILHFTVWNRKRNLVSWAKYPLGLASPGCFIGCKFCSFDLDKQNSKQLNRCQKNMWLKKGIKCKLWYEFSIKKPQTQKTKKNERGAQQRHLMAHPMNGLFKVVWMCGCHLVISEPVVVSGVNHGPERSIRTWPET